MRHRNPRPYLTLAVRFKCGKLLWRYRGAVRLAKNLDPAAVFEELFESNGWGRFLRNGIYDYVHYHSRIHEVLGVARGEGTVQFGGHLG